MGVLSGARHNLLAQPLVARIQMHPFTPHHRHVIAGNGERRRIRDQITAALLASLGHHVEPAVLELGVSWPAFVHANAQIWCANLAPWIAALALAGGRKPSPATLEPSTLACYAYGKTIAATELVGALAVRNSVTRAAAAFFESCDVLKLAGQLERAAPWAGRRPPVWAGDD